jgi:hypothetical protein
VSRSITAGSTPTDGFAGVKGTYTRAPDDQANLSSPSLQEQAQQFSTLFSQAGPALQDGEGPPEAGYGEGVENPASEENGDSLQDPLAAKGPGFLEELPFSKELTLARFLADGKARQDSPAGTSIDPFDSRTDREVDVASFVAPQWPAPQIPVAPTQPPAGAAPDWTFAELVQRHVRRTLAVQATNGSGADEVRLELSDAVLPGATLSLRRAGAGWQLLATTDHRQTKEKLGRFAPALIARFAAASLGPLEIITDDPRASETPSWESS